ncbi:hypothetical protein GCM10010174_03830 [Kutzneria viridogrisea]
MGAAAEYLADVGTLLARAADLLAVVVERLRGAGGEVVPPGARAARAPVPGRTHPAQLPVPPVAARDRAWADRVGAQLTTWLSGAPTDALVFDSGGSDWQVNSGADQELTAAARSVVEKMIASGAVGGSGNLVNDAAERTALRASALHAETKAAAWAAANGVTWLDVVTNRDYACGEDFRPGDRKAPPGCVQAIAAILPVGATMRIWRRGIPAPLTIKGARR